MTMEETHLALLPYKFDNAEVRPSPAKAQGEATRREKWRQVVTNRFKCCRAITSLKIGAGEGTTKAQG